VRILLMGGQDITDAVAERMGVPHAQAEAIKQQLGFGMQAPTPETQAGRPRRRGERLVLRRRGPRLARLLHGLQRVRTAEPARAHRRRRAAQRPGRPPGRRSPASLSSTAPRSTRSNSARRGSPPSRSSSWHRSLRCRSVSPSELPREHDDPDAPGDDAARQPAASGDRGAAPVPPRADGADRHSRRRPARRGRALLLAAGQVGDAQSDLDAQTETGQRCSARSTPSPRSRRCAPRWTPPRRA
jgi:hypothetical protein